MTNSRPDPLDGYNTPYAPRWYAQTDGPDPVRAVSLWDALHHNATHPEGPFYRLHRGTQPIAPRAAAPVPRATGPAPLPCGCWVWPGADHWSPHPACDQHRADGDYRICRN